MKTITGYLTRLRRVFRRREFEGDMAAEMRDHLELETARRIATGENPTTARRRAAAAFGSVDACAEEVRDHRLGAWFDTTRQDLRQAFRVLRKSPGFTAIAISTIALCLAANAVLFTLIRSILLQPYDYPRADRVVNVGMVWPQWQWGDMVQEISPRTFLDIHEGARSFTAFGFIDASGKIDLHQGDGTDRLEVARVTADVWSVTRVPAALGRVFTARELAAGETHLAVLSHDLWQSRFGGDPAVIGRTVRLDNQAHEIVGVMPAGFTIASNRSQLWLPKVFSDFERSEHSRRISGYQAIGRLRDGVSIEQARHELQALYASFLETHPEAREFTEQTGQTYGVAAATTWVGERSSGDMLLSLQMAAGLVLLLGCLNIGGLLIVRGHRRLREFALRSALGASRRRLARQLTAETLVLFLCGGAASVALTLAALQWVPAHFHLAEIIPYGQTIGFDGGILAATLGLALATGLLTGVLPILFATRRNLNTVLQSLNHQSTASRGSRTTQSVFVIAQIALALVMLTAAGVTVRNLHALLDTGFGVATENRLVATVALPDYRYGSDFPATMDNINPFKDRALEELRALPGVTGASVSNRVPLSRDWPQKFGFEVPGYHPTPGENPAIAFAYEIHPDYFATIGTPLLRGRDITHADDAGSLPVVIISDEIARRYFPDRDPIGQRLAFSGRECEIIGIAGATQNVPLSLGNAPTLYLSAKQWPVFHDESVFIVRSELPPEALATAVTAALTRVDPLLSVRITDLERLQQSAVVTQSTPMEIATLFALVAVLLTSLGLYGVLATTVAQRNRELAIRLALGASNRSLFRNVLLSGTRLALIGSTVGALIALPLLQWIQPLLATSETTPATMILPAIGIIITVTLLASYLPARRASKVDPITSLRAE